MQVGTFGGGGVLAWTAASDTGYTPEGLPWSPRFGLKADVASGDGDPDDPGLGTFNPLFPKGAYFTEASLVAPANLFDVYPYLAVQPFDALTLTAGWEVLWRYSTDDAFYTQPLSPLVSAEASSKRFVGHQATLEAEWQAGRHLTLNAAYVHFFTDGGAIEDAGGRDVDFVSLWAAYTF